MRNYSKAVSTKNTPQTSPIFGRTDMIENNAGGYVFKISPQEQLERFLLLGTENGSYYAGEQKLTEDNAKSIINYVKTNGLKVVSTVVDFAVNRKAPKADAGLFVLALAATYGDEATKKDAYYEIANIATTATQLFTFVSNIQNLRGWSRGLRKGVSRFYTGRTPEQIAYQMIKYRSRSGFTHKDVLRLCHASSVDKAQNSLFGYAVGKVSALEVNSVLVSAFEAAQNESDIKTLLALISENALTWEMIPTDKLNNSEILTALLEKMPVHALIRNLNRFSYNGMTNGITETVKTIVSKLTNEDLVKKARVHPVMVINSMLTYSNGHGDKGNKTWDVNQNIVDALGTTYELALKNLVPTNKNILVAVDVSGSMNHSVGGTSMLASQLSNVLAATLLKSEPNAEVILFDTQAYHADFGRRSSIDEVLKKSRNGGGTDCSLPFKYSLEFKKKFDAIVILTDSETWAGNSHGVQVLEQYRKSINPDVKVVEVALVANPHTTLPTDDKNVVRTVGFDSGVLDIINKFLV